MNPYTPPTDDDIERPPVYKPQLNRPPAKPIRTFVGTIFVAMFLAGPYQMTAPLQTVACVFAIGLIAVYVNRVYSREY